MGPLIYFYHDNTNVSKQMNVPKQINLQNRMSVQDIDCLTKTRFNVGKFSVGKHSVSFRRFVRFDLGP